MGLLFGGCLVGERYRRSDPALSKSIIIGEIHLLSSYLAFTCGLRSGLMHYLGCGIIPISSVSGVLAAAFVSGNADVAERTVLHILGGCFAVCAGNEMLAARFNMSPRWYAPFR
ncbi:hypothetical protein, conserved [Babesia bigemina]|uniref:Uncharacterized protein n=1 Tax=Babesia bigemina TaxID=5866 RepID=A0A061DCF3_BABBI|nr:hypothetical protein, conserved [Babesia bigemina]CDR97762.1 hypothetical protein, conserved [Babesia bigemina]|eukprot:XP_012769948.1 hypothetical protein, conserved [Babesia bigemina]